MGMIETPDTATDAPRPAPPASQARRLVRLTDQKRVSGVAAGLGYYFGVDPTLVRVAFAVTGLLSFGLAVAVYGVMWWLLPPTTVARSGLSAPPPGAGRAHGLQVTAVVIGLLMLSQLQWVSGQVVLAVVLIGVGLVLFNDGSGPSGLDAASRWLRGAFASDTAANTTASPRVAAGPPPPTGPPTSAYANPYRGGYTPAPPAPPARAPRERSALGLLTLAVWLLAMGAAAIANGLGIVSLTLPSIAALTVLVAGLGLLVGSVIGRARGLIAIGLIGSLFWVVGTLAVQVDVGVPLSGGVGERTLVPTTVAEITDYRMTAGDMTVDLTNLDLDGATVPVAASVALGELRVIVPDDVTVRATGGVRAGEYAVLGSDESGTGLTFDVEEPGVEGAGVLDLELDSGAGTITVTREDDQ